MDTLRTDLQIALLSRSNVLFVDSALPIENSTFQWRNHRRENERGRLTSSRKDLRIREKDHRDRPRVEGSKYARPAFLGPKYFTAASSPVSPYSALPPSSYGDPSRPRENATLRSCPYLGLGAWEKDGRTAREVSLRP